MSVSNNVQKNKKSKEIWQSVRQNKMAMVGLVTLAVFVLIAIFGPILVPFSTQEFGGMGDVLRPPGGDHLLGTDDMGRDVLANLMAGARISLLIGGVATIISMAIGTLVGISAGYFGGAVDNVLMRLTDFFLVIPWLPLMMVLAAILGTSIWNIILVIGVTSWAGTARVVRAQTLSVKERQFVERTLSLGAGNWHIMWKHILPNVFPLVFANTVLIAATAITSETTLSFLGLGDTTTASWGMMLHYAFECGATGLGAYWYYLPPGICVIAVVLAFTLLGYAFDEILNPKLKER
ncbi:MAG: ABC transporter permease [Emergencia timonensis]|uniref:ABC transporter permease n=1 Tax=Emergencia timonensis TaxID=1776384 RepID=UPI000830B9D2|nr:ABC transporter permease [Emergencia timonensis]WNX88592.1 ABC transporter permease [Emergencia timonensis]